MSSPPPIPYSSGRAEEDGPRITAATLISACCLLFLLWCLYTAYWQFFSDQIGLFNWLDRAMIYFGWDKQNGPSNTLMFFSSSYGLSNNYPGSMGYSVQLALSLNQLPFAAGFGVFISAALFHWRSMHVRLLAMALPVMAGVWRYLELTAASLTSASAPSVYPIVRPATSAGVTTMGVGLLALAIFLQAATAYVCAWLGRPFASWLAGMLLPRGLSKPLQSLWIER